MRKLIIFTSIILLSTSLNAQILFEQSFNFSTAQTILENDGHKYFLMDVAAEQCRIYNTDYSIWKTIQFDIPNNQSLSDIKFVSQNIFNSDSKVEMLIIYSKYFETQTSYYYKYTTEIIDEDGNVLLSVPGGAYANLVADSESGSKLFIYAYDYSEWPYDVETKIYSVPGLPLGIDEGREENLITVSSQFQVFPNPNDGSMTLGVNQNLGNENSRLIVRDIQGKEVYNVQLQKYQPEQQINLMSLDSGTYFYEVSTPYLKLKPKKLIISR